MAWALAALIPYLSLIIFGGYNLKYPGMFGRNPRRNYVCEYGYAGQLGLSSFTTVTQIDRVSGLPYERNAFWLRGTKDDFFTMQQIKKAACEEGTIPVIVFSLHPPLNLPREGRIGRYMDKERTQTWEEYDEQLEYYAEHLADVPSVIVLEPNLLMHAFNSQTEYPDRNTEISFAARVETVTGKFKKSWVYVDVGNAMYLQWTVNLEHVIAVLKNMPVGIRGVSVNVASFVNSTYSRVIAEEIHCQTGLHYIIETSRNGGDFSTRTLEEMDECIYDPPYVERGVEPSWQMGSSSQFRSVLERKKRWELEDVPLVDNFGRRRKRWEFEDSNTGNAPIYEPVIPGGGVGVGDDGGSGEAYYYGDYYYPGRACVSAEEGEGLDAFAWIKIPGEADGRLFPAGTLHPCLIGHAIECSETCPESVPMLDGEVQRPDFCKCEERSGQ